MKNQQKTKNQAPQNKTVTTKPNQQQPQPQQKQQEQQQQQQQEQQQPPVTAITKTTQTPQDGPETKTKPQQQQQPTTQNGSLSENTKQRERQQEQKKNPQNPGAGKEHHVGDIEEPQTENMGDEEIKEEPDPTIPERRKDPVAGKNDDYSRTRNTPGKSESNSVGEFTEVDEMDREDDENETSNISDEERDEEEPGSFDPETEHKEAFSGERKNSRREEKNKNGL